ncbi:MAG TPA: hypothetical protein VL688_11895 [Verrucomicrobiae bacterium]|nr:hypothetical protein [Verrucomicrobiae bacterium]
MGELLIEDGLLTQENLEEALCYQKKEGGLIGQILIQLGYLSEEDLVSALCRQLGMPYLPLVNYAVNMEAVHLLTEEFCRHAVLVVIDYDETRVFVAVSDPLNATVIEDLRQRLKLKPQVFVSTASEILNMLDLAYSKQTPKVEKRKAG